jgi:hypothetical protein
LRTAKATSEAAISAEIPSSESSAQSSTPTSLPAIVRRPARQPPRIALRKTIAVPAPGVIVTRIAIGTNAQITQRTARKCLRMPLPKPLGWPVK